MQTQTHTFTAHIQNGGIKSKCWAAKKKYNKKQRKGKCKENETENNLANWTNEQTIQRRHTHTHTQYKIQNTHTPRPGYNWNLNHSNNVSKVQCWYYPVVNGVNYVFVPFNVFSTKLIFDFHCWCRLQSDWIGFRIIHITFNDIPSDCLLFLFALDIVCVCMCM